MSSVGNSFATTTTTTTNQNKCNATATWWDNFLMKTTDTNKELETDSDMKKNRSILNSSLQKTSKQKNKLLNASKLEKTNYSHALKSATKEYNELKEEQVNDGGRKKGDKSINDIVSKYNRKYNLVEKC